VPHLVNVIYACDADHRQSRVEGRIISSDHVSQPQTRRRIAGAGHSFGAIACRGSLLHGRDACSDADRLPDMLPDDGCGRHGARCATHGAAFQRAVLQHLQRSSVSRRSRAAAGGSVLRGSTHFICHADARACDRPRGLRATQAPAFSRFLPSSTLCLSDLNRLSPLLIASGDLRWFCQRVYPPSCIRLVCCLRRH
jgi:hypothetical protein